MPEYTSEQRVINEVYAAIDLGNKNLMALGADFRIERWVAMVHLPDREEVQKALMATETGNICPECGGTTIRTGTCESCLNCGHSEGCG